MARILLVDDEPCILDVLERLLHRESFKTARATDGTEALECLRRDGADLMIADLRLGKGMDGIELMHAAHRVQPELPVIVITAYGTIETAVRAIKDGAVDFICKPFDLGDVLKVTRDVLQARSQAHASGTEGCADGLPTLHFGTLVGESAAMQQVYKVIERVAPTDATVLITGESGTGKELAARALHTASRRADGPWVPLNCAALPGTLLESEMFGHAAGAFTGATAAREGLFMAATNGTLFLDEIGVLEMGLQGKLLRALQEGKVRPVGENEDLPVNVRVVAATNESLEAKRDSRQFREDLYYRISVVPLTMPPLRERHGDLSLLVAYLCRQQAEIACHPIELADGVIDMLAAHPWPGNVRQLSNAIACAAALSEDGLIRVDDLPPAVSEAQLPPDADALPAEGEALSLKAYLREKEQQYMELVLRRTGGNRARAADLLGISRATFYRRFPDVAKA